MPFFTRSKPTVTPFPIYAYPTAMIAGDLPADLEKRYNLISLTEANQRPEVVYHCVGANTEFAFVDSAFCDGYYKSPLSEECARSAKLERRKAIRRQGREGEELLARVRALCAEC